MENKKIGTRFLILFNLITFSSGNGLKKYFLGVPFVDSRLEKLRSRENRSGVCLKAFLRIFGIFTFSQKPFKT